MFYSVSFYFFNFILVCNFFFLDWFFSLKYHFTPDIIYSINNSVFGEIKNLRTSIGFNNPNTENKQQVEIRTGQNQV